MQFSKRLTQISRVKKVLNQSDSHSKTVVQDDYQILTPYQTTTIKNIIKLSYCWCKKAWNRSKWPPPPQTQQKVDTVHSHSAI